MSEGVWVYCVAGEDLPETTIDADGVACPHQPRVLRAAGLTAVVSTVPLDEFGEEGLKRNLNDIDWLEHVARAHEQVLEAALPGGPLIPMSVCTIYSTEEHVEALLAERRQAFADALAELTGRSEWAVKVVADRERIADTVRPRGGDTAAAPGGAGSSYLGRRQRDLRLRDEVDATLDIAARESHARLEEWAVASELLPPQRKELAGYEGEMVHNGAYLVDGDRLAAFERVVERLRDDYTYAGLAVELTGPWPACHFVGSLVSPQGAAR
jgi:hypothetical protein